MSLVFSVGWMCKKGKKVRKKISTDIGKERVSFLSVVDMIVSNPGGSKIIMRLCKESGYKIYVKK